MIQEVRLPDISEDVKTGEVIKVLVSEGDAVEVDQPLVELETDKAVLEVPCPYQGRVKEIMVKKGDTVEVGQAIMKIETEGGAESKTEAGKEDTRKEEPGPGKKEKRVTRDRAAPKEEREVAKPTARKEEEKRETPPPASPGVRRLARELEIDLKQVEGGGPGGRITEDDVKKFARRARTEAEKAGAGREGGTPGETDPWGPIERQAMSKVRLATARNMGRAWSTIPQVTQYDKADITKLDALMKRYAPRVEEAGGKLTITAVLVKMAASALRVFPQFNASIDPEKEEIVYKKYYHMGVAVDTDRGLIVPVVRDADAKNVTELSVEIGTLARRAREKKIAPGDLEGGTFTISNLGGIGGTGFSPIVYAPQVAILGVARARMEPVYEGETFVPRRLLPLALTYDHRIIDGADGARFLQWIVQTLEEPFMTLLEG